MTILAAAFVLLKLMKRMQKKHEERLALRTAQDLLAGLPSRYLPGSANISEQWYRERAEKVYIHLMPLAITAAARGDVNVVSMLRTIQEGILSVDDFDEIAGVAYATKKLGVGDLIRLREVLRDRCLRSWRTKWWHNIVDAWISAKRNDDVPQGTYHELAQCPDAWTRLAEHLATTGQLDQLHLMYALNGKDVPEERIQQVVDYAFSLDRYRDSKALIELLVKKQQFHTLELLLPILDEEGKGQCFNAFWNAKRMTLDASTKAELEPKPSE